MKSLVSVVIPVYRNQDSADALIESLEVVAGRWGGEFELILVVDGSPDDSAGALREAVAKSSLQHVQMLHHSRNFGSFPAVRTGLEVARGDYIAVIAADLQEPPELILDFAAELDSGQYDIVIGARETRDDPFASRTAARAFWGIYRRIIDRNVPPGGVDVFACTTQVRDSLVSMSEANSSLIGLLFWLGYRRKTIYYERRARHAGTSAWTFGRKVKYLTDSLVSFTDLPLRMLVGLGAVGLATSIFLALATIGAKLAGTIDVPGYAATILIVTFFATLNLLSVGLMGLYIWRSFENTKHRPHALVMKAEVLKGSLGTERGAT